MQGDVAALYERAATAWPALRVTPERFARELVRRNADAGVHTDIYLAIAASDGDPEAARVCEAIVAREVEFAAGKLRATPTQADDARSELRRLFFTSDADRPAALATFTGRGDLRGYARVVAARALARRMQRDKREDELDSQVLGALVQDADPEIVMLRERYRETVEAALEAALASLGPRERAVLRFHLVDGWTIDELAARYHTHRSTAARWLAAAREQLRLGIRGRLATELAITESQVDSIVALVTSRIEVSLDRLLS